MPTYTLIKQASKNAQHVLEKYPDPGPNCAALKELETAIEPLRKIPSCAWDTAAMLLAEARFYYSTHTSEIRNRSWRVRICHESHDEMYLAVLRIRLEAIKHLSGY
ncbi:MULTISPECIES: hypothetical protein [unclassified Caballeronia]|uniref:hypothetical protein n=1 Tax=unclassified Caballeronia TaxID=2646786 RepID=UPI0028638E63|nr:MULTISPECIES: hypothetical protein [unclassified Caballeronia]MDR5771489.1 hypothetical protein [Caballeronia sp. LZ002]MDR5805250.1 hypothetical protein [Caballeronia sp. LZ001]MDR5846925.1 hypothetical protein [Caballeronia sp. LZ003]